MIQVQSFIQNYQKYTALPVPITSDMLSIRLFLDNFLPILIFFQGPNDAQFKKVFFFNFLFLTCAFSVCQMLTLTKDVMQGKLFQKCTYLLYCSVLSLGGNVNTRRMLQPDMGSIFHIKKSMKYSGHRKLLCEISKLSNLMLLTSSDTKRTLMHLFLFTNSSQRELVSICTQSIHDRN